MSGEVAVETVPPQLVAGVPSSTTTETLSADAAASTSILGQHVKDSGLTVTGPLIAFYAGPRP